VKIRTAIIATTTYVGVLVAFWITARFLDVERHIGEHLTSSFAAFAFLFAPYWFFGFGLAQALRERLRARRYASFCRDCWFLPMSSSRCHGETYA
jgi:hypothetical protein